jgi:hypothetical protein
MAKKKKKGKKKGGARRRTAKGRFASGTFMGRPWYAKGGRKKGRKGKGRRKAAATHSFNVTKPACTTTTIKGHRRKLCHGPKRIKPRSTGWVIVSNRAA